MTDLPLTGGSMIMGVRAIDGIPLARDEASPLNLHYRSATPNYMSVLEMPLLRGRHLNERDVPGASAVVVINETAARRLFADGADRLGRRFSLNVRDDVVEFSVVGVTADARIVGSDLQARAEVWSSIWHVPWNRFRLVVHAPGGPCTSRCCAKRLPPSIPRCRLRRSRRSNASASNP